jgi:hypothetical protein
MRKIHYTQTEALEELFKTATPSGLGKSDYDKILVYKRRYENDKLGQRAINNLLTKFGYKKIETIIYYTKDRTQATDKE